MSPVAASLKLDPIVALPVLQALRTYRDTRWGRLQPHLDAIADAALTPTTPHFHVDALGSTTWTPYPDLPPRPRPLPIWVEGVSPLFPPESDDGIPVGILFTRDLDRLGAIIAQIVAIPRRELPFTAAARVVIDLRPDDDHASLGLADTYRAACALPTTTDATAEQLIAAEGRAVLADDRVWLRSHTGEPLSTSVIDLPPIGTRNGSAAEAMRAAHARTFVERLPYELHPDDAAYAEEQSIALISRTMLWRTIIKGPYIALAALDALSSKQART